MHTFLPLQFWLKMIAEIVSRQLINIESQSAVQGMSLEEVIGNVLKANWDHERTKFSLPPMMTLVSSIKYMLYDNIAYSSACIYLFQNVSVRPGIIAYLVLISLVTLKLTSY